MNGGDMSNADLGIAIVDAKGAKERLLQNNSGEQLSLNEKAMGERTIGYVLAVFIVVLGIIWATDTSAIIQYSATAGVILLMMLGVFCIFRSKSRLKKLRDCQLEAHARKS